MRILLIEDDMLIGEGLKYGLSKLNYNVDWFTDGKLGYEAVKAAEYDVAILDLTLPRMDGLEVLDNWRNEGVAVPVLVLTARDTVDQRVEGLKTGADDYLGKPFALSEIIARIEALLRRSKGNASPIMTHGKVSLDPASRIVTWNGQEISLTSKEYQLVYLFLLNRERVLPRSMIEEKLNSWDSDVNSNALEVHIHNIRKKLGTKFIRTIHGVGYVIGKLDD